MTWGAVASIGVGMLGNAMTSSGSTNAGNNASALAGWKPMGITDLLGSVTPTAHGYASTPNLATQQQSDMFGGIAQLMGTGIDPSQFIGATNTAAGVNQGVGAGLLNQAAQNNGVVGQMMGQIPGAGQQFNNAGSAALSALGNFNPQAYAQQAYNSMSGLQNAYNTDQTQNMLNYEQEAGRGGLMQNGQLGDLGGVALAQGLTDNNLRQQAMQMGQNQQQLLGNQASQFAGVGQSQAQSALNNYLSSLTNGANLATLGSNQYSAAAGQQNTLMNSLLTGATNAQSGQLNINSALQNALNSSINASQGQAVANNNAAMYGYQSGMANANNTGNFINGISAGLNNSGAYSSLSNLFKGYGGGGIAQNAMVEGGGNMSGGGDISDLMDGLTG